MATSYENLLKEAKKNLPKLSEKRERFEIPNIKGHIQGNKTILSNFTQIAQYLGRKPEHMLKFVLKELATPGEIKKTGTIIGSKLPASRINDKIRAYAEKYVLCKECKKPDTKLEKENGIIYIKCMACGAKKPA
jgi:translation initiation factor 2 subunit 2